MLLGEDPSLAAATPVAEGWLAEVAKSDWPSSNELPGAVYAVATRLLALEHGGYMPPDLVPRTRLRTVAVASRFEVQTPRDRLPSSSRRHGLRRLRL